MEKRKLKPVNENPINSIIKTIVELMNKVECVLNLSGLDKFYLIYVLNETKKLLGDEVYIDII